MSDVDQRRADPGVVRPREEVGGGRHARLRRLLHQLRTEHSGAGRDPVAVALGVFIGCTPLYGLHLAISLLLASLFRVNKLKVYLAANISNPFMLPFLLFAEVQTGALLRHGAFHPLTREAIAATSPWSFGLDLVVGSVVVGLVLAAVFGTLTYALMRTNDPAYSALAGRAAERYAPASFTAWEFANGKLRGDPVYRQALDLRMLPGGNTLVDVGCGQGLMLAVLLEAREAEQMEPRVFRPGDRSAPQWPRYEQLIGIESRPRTAKIAATALAGPGVEILSADGRETPLPPCDAVLLFDVLHMMPIGAQDALVRAVRAALRPGGVALVREADATGGWRFLLVRTGNRLKALLGASWRQPLVFRRPEEWVQCFRDAGFVVEVFPGPAGHPFANTLYRLGVRRGSDEGQTGAKAWSDPRLTPV